MSSFRKYNTLIKTRKKIIEVLNFNYENINNKGIYKVSHFKDVYNKTNDKVLKRRTIYDYWGKKKSK